MEYNSILLLTVLTPSPTRNTIIQLRMYMYMYMYMYMFYAHFYVYVLCKIVNT